MHLHAPGTILDRLPLSDAIADNFHALTEAEVKAALQSVVAIFKALPPEPGAIGAAVRRDLLVALARIDAGNFVQSE